MPRVIPASRFVAGVLLGFVLSGSSVLAQLTVEPQSVAVSVAQYGVESRTVTLTNDGTEPLSFCLSFERPLQRVADGTARLAASALGSDEPCGAYGEVLALIPA